MGGANGGAVATKCSGSRSQLLPVNHISWGTSKEPAMRRCSRVRPNQVSATPLSSTPRRWKSYDRESLSDEALLPQLEEGLGDSADSPRLDLTRKSVRTAAGELPISPLFDPKWIASGRRTTKSAPPKKPSGRFRSKVYNNPYGRLSRPCLSYGGIMLMETSASIRNPSAKMHTDEEYPASLLSARL